MSLNRQLVLNDAVTGLITQGQPAYDTKKHNCHYRIGSLRCAVGFLIPDNLYTPAMDASGGHDASASIVQQAIDPKYGTVEDSDDTSFLVELQRCHDIPAVNDPPARFIEEFTRAVSGLARDFRLEMPNAS